MFASSVEVMEALGASRPIYAGKSEAAVFYYQRLSRRLMEMTKAAEVTKPLEAAEAVEAAKEAEATEAVKRLR